MNREKCCKFSIMAMIPAVVLFPLLLFIGCNTPKTQTSIKMKKEGGVFLLPCKINGLEMEFMLDTGASDVSISLTEAMFMLRHGYLRETDFVGVEKYSLANGNLEESDSVILREMEIGGLKLFNVKASLTRELAAPVLLGQSALSKLGNIEIDYASNTLIIKNSSLAPSKPSEEANKNKNRKCQYKDDEADKVDEIVILRSTGQPVNGVVCIYHDNGNVAIEVPCKDGKQDGIVKSYYESGKLKGEIPYKDGKEDGIVKSYYESGKLQVEATYKDGKEDGIRAWYSESGRLWRKILYKNDEPVSGACGDGRALTNAELANWQNERTVPSCAKPW